MNESNKPNLGNLIISDDVIVSIAKNAAKDVDGVADFSKLPVDFFYGLKPNNSSTGAIKVWSADNEVKLQLSIVLANGANIPAVCSQVQKNVKASVQSMTGKVVTKVNVRVSGIDFSEPTEVKA